LRISFDNTYATLPEAFFHRQPPAPVSAPSLLRLNDVLAASLGLDPAQLATEEAVAVFAGNRVPAGADPLAMAYAGHQFAHWVPRLGDGRALLLGEIRSPDGRRWDVQLKGSGPTAFSRGGDGRSALGPVIREFVVSEAMAGLGIPTTRSLAMVRTGEDVLRQWGPEPGGVLTRVAASHVRVGTFQYFLGLDDQEALRALTRYVIDRHYPEIADAANPALALLTAVCERTADLIVRWQLVGFIHGVMNTDNMSIVGETLDFGPCAFMDAFHPDKVFSSIDRHGRYAWSNQPMIGAWNMGRLADTLLGQMGQTQDAAVELAKEALNAYATRVATGLEAGWRAKLGLAEAMPDDAELAEALLSAMAANGADFTRTFRALADLPASPDGAGAAAVREEFDDPAAFDAWAVRYRARLARESRPDGERREAMRAVNPAFIARNHLVERVIRESYDRGDSGLLDDLLEVLARPFDDHPDRAALALAPTPQEEVRQTFCGT
jgi:uncharacterized protein YdiU (UPF0061 family)